MIQKKYALRYAADAYWLVNIAQNSGQYIPPLQLNKMGADIIKMVLNNQTQEGIIQSLSEEYGVASDVLTADVESFFEMLNRHGVTL